MPRPRPILWAFLRPLYRLSPQPLHGIRRKILNLCGARVAPTTKIRPSAHIDRPWNLTAGHLTIFGDDAQLILGHPLNVGDRCVISQNTLLATSLVSPDQPPGPPSASTRIEGPITIGDDCWIAADTLVYPGVTVEAGTVVGARAVVTGDLPGWKVCVGSPARPIKDRAFVNAGGPRDP